MMDQIQILWAASERTLVRDFDGQTSIPTGEMDTDGETILAEIVSSNFRRWSDLLDLERAS